MLEKFKSSLLNNLKIFGLILLIIFTIVVATLSNHQKKISNPRVNISKFFFNFSLIFFNIKNY